jgi:hypothetical protein
MSEQGSIREFLALVPEFDSEAAVEVESKLVVRLGLPVTDDPAWNLRMFASLMRNDPVASRVARDLLLEERVARGFVVP